MATSGRGRKTVEQQIATTKAKLKALRAAQKEQLKSKLKNKIKDLTKDSEGMTELLAAIEAVSKTHKIKVPEVIKVVARIKRTGLRIENAIRGRQD